MDLTGQGSAADEVADFQPVTALRLVSAQRSRCTTSRFSSTATRSAFIPRIFSVDVKFHDISENVRGFHQKGTDLRRYHARFAAYERKVFRKWSYSAVPTA
jgi:hypothetical protein